jgi:hypothetical protein
MKAAELLENNAQPRRDYCAYGRKYLSMRHISQDRARHPTRLKRSRFAILKLCSRIKGFVINRVWGTREANRSATQPRDAV